MSLESIVNVQISRETAAVSQAGFGAGNFLSNTAVFSDRIKVYSSLKAVTDDTLAGSDTLTFAQKYFGQSLRPTQLYVTKKGRLLAQVSTLVFSEDFVTGNTLNGSINGVAIAAVPFDTDHATTIADVATELAAHADIATAVASGRTITITTTAGLNVTLSGFVVTGGASQATAVWTVSQYGDVLSTNVASLIAGSLVNNDWYALAAYEKDSADILDIAAYIQGQRKIYAVSSADAAILTSVTSDVASQLKAASYDRTIFLYSATAAAFPEGAWLGVCLPTNPGSITWKFKSLSGVTVDSITETQKTIAAGKNANTYTVIGGRNITEEGVTSEGTFIDIIRGTDWIQARITENVFQAFVTQPKIPYTDQGVSIIVNRIQQILDQAVANGVLTNNPSPTISAPLVANVPVNDRANRILPDVTFEGVLAGAIHKVTIFGTVSV